MRVLVVEDHPDLAANLQDFLSSQDHESVVAADGADGLRRAQSGGFDAIVLDRMLPKLSGDELCKRLRKDGSRVPILMLTARDAVDDRVAGLTLGADDYLVKPFAFAELGARLEALHRRAGGAGGAGGKVLRVADLEYDTDTLQARRGGEALELNPTGRKLLEYLMREQHRVVPHGELSELLWGKAATAPDALRVHIHMLRQAVDGPFKHKLLSTVHGTGYRISERNET